MIAIVHSIYSQSVHALALNAESMDNDARRYCKLPLHKLRDPSSVRKVKFTLYTEFSAKFYHQ